MFNLLILSFMDALQPEPLSARAHQGHALSIGFGLLLIGVAGLGLVGASPLPGARLGRSLFPVLIALYFVAMRVIFTHEQQRRARETQEVAEELQYRRDHAAVSGHPLQPRRRSPSSAAALWLPRLGAELARQTGLGEAFVGSLFIAITTSLPEIVVSLTAVRIGALDLGIGNVLGSNLFNLLILGLDDVFYRKGPSWPMQRESQHHDCGDRHDERALSDRIDLQGDHEALCRGVGHRGDRGCLCRRCRLVVPAFPLNVLSYTAEATASGTSSSPLSSKGSNVRRNARIATT